jgi:hypothetical protein
MASTFVDARFAGGAIVVAGGDFLEQPVVRLVMPGANPLPLFPHEARALAAELVAYAVAAEKRNAPGAVAAASEGEIQNH